MQTALNWRFANAAIARQHVTVAFRTTAPSVLVDFSQVADAKICQMYSELSNQRSICTRFSTVTAARLRRYFSRT